MPLSGQDFRRTMINTRLPFAFNFSNFRRPPFYWNLRMALNSRTLMENVRESSGDKFVSSLTFESVIPQVFYDFDNSGLITPSNGTKCPPDEYPTEPYQNPYYNAQNSIGAQEVKSLPFKQASNADIDSISPINFIGDPVIANSSVNTPVIASILITISRGAFRQWIWP